MRLRVLESHFSRSAREMGHPACVKVRVKIKVKVKGNGPECPFHPSRSGDSRFLTGLGAWFGMTGIGAGFACSVPLAAFGLKPGSFSLGGLRHDWKSCPSRSCSRQGAQMASTSCIGPSLGVFRFAGDSAASG